MPDLITTCPRCGGEIELWSEEDETLCIFCDTSSSNEETTTPLIRRSERRTDRRNDPAGIAAALV